MPGMSQDTLQLVSTFVIVIGAVTVMFVRLRAARRPTSARRIIMPPLGMVTGFLMFVFPFMRISWLYGVAAFLAGCLFSVPLIMSSHMQRVEGAIYLKRSPAFIIVLLALLVIRLSLHPYIERFVTIPQTGAIFFILAFGMLLPWRVAMYLRFRAFAAAAESGEAGDLPPEPSRGRA